MKGNTIPSPIFVKKKKRPIILLILLELLFPVLVEDVDMAPLALLLPLKPTLAEDIFLLKILTKEMENTVFIAGVMDTRWMNAMESMDTLRVILVTPNVQNFITHRSSLSTVPTPPPKKSLTKKTEFLGIPPTGQVLLSHQVNINV
ncbi:unnamed protein product [Sphenostylis stenocarpa]|uniref:Uncharacterized protein n=1 Tax=Sphenostylis stenocarpa TaxID=92480 RepID=A0AA86V1C1_9FABA|nr:unnamed protein product [Sphenostylis stenocarpa]